MLKISAVYLIGKPEIPICYPNWALVGQALLSNLVLNVKSENLILSIPQIVGEHKVEKMICRETKKLGLLNETKTPKPSQLQLPFKFQPTEIENQIGVQIGVQIEVQTVIKKAGFSGKGVPKIVSFMTHNSNKSKKKVSGNIIRTYRLFFLRSITQFFTQIYMNWYFSS